MRQHTCILGAALMAVAASAVSAQPPRDRIREGARVYVASDDDDRPALGITTSTTGKRDTLGVLIVDVTPGGPAEKAGLQEGDRIAAINGVSLTLDPADANEDDMEGIMSRRLVRELRKVKVGDDVSLKIYSKRATKTVKVKTIELSELRPTRVRFADHEDDDRAAVGLDFGGGSRRDSLGLLVVNVTNDGPAEKAGIIEGARIAAINGVDVRVPADEAGEDALAWARQRRFVREMRKVKPGDKIDLTVWANGSQKKVNVTTAKASDLYSRRDRDFHIHVRDGNWGDGMFMAPMAPMAPMPPLPPVPPLPALRPHVGEDVIIDLPDYQRITERAMREAQRALQQSRRTLDANARRIRDAWPGTNAVWTQTAWQPGNVTFVAPAVSVSRDASSFDVSVPGLRLTQPSAELAPYFGSESKNGLLVLAADSRWTGLRPGDVILSANGRAIRTPDAISQLTSKQAITFVVIRHAARQIVTTPAN